MSSLPYFTVIIPTLNEEKLLPKLLGDLQKQKDQNFEIIIADGKSEDKTKEKALEFKNVLSLTFFENERKNVAYQRNYGAKYAKGSYLVFLDADARVNSTFTKNLKKFIENKGGLVFIPYIKPEKSTPEIEATYKLINYLIEFSQHLDKPFSSSGSMIWEKNFFILVEGFDESIFIGEDHSIIQKAERWGVRAKFLKNIKITYSLRRIKKEGRLTSLYKLLVGVIYQAFKGDVKKKIFQYDMGGQEYNKKDLRRKNIQEALEQIKNIYNV